MKKIALLLIPALLLMLGLPVAVALIVMTVSAPAAAQELPTIACAGLTPVTGPWRPPFAQPYTVGQRGFGPEFHPIYHEWRLHTGQDLVSQPGPGPVVAIGAGQVTFAGTRGGYGNVVDVEHVDDATGTRVVSRYAHLASVRVSTGAAVAGGQQLGVEGSTGASTGNHLHFEIRVGGTPTDPVPWMLAHGAPFNGQAVASWTPPPGQPVQEGGVGFPLPPPGTPRQASLHTPAQPIPADVKAAYLAAEARYKIPWTLLAGIGMEETAHGRNDGTSSAGARGLMQFLPATWATMGVDGDGDDRADITNDADSAMSAANYLTKSGVTNGPAGVRAAIFAYNHADWYVNDVLFYAAAYGSGTVLGSTTECGPGQGDPDLAPLTSDRLRVVLTWATGHVGDRYVMGAHGPHAWDCSSFTEAAYAQVGITTPRTAGATWLARRRKRLPRRPPAGQARRPDLLRLLPGAQHHRPRRHRLRPTKQSTVEAMDRRHGVTYGSYAGKATTKHIFQIWRVGNVSDQPTRTAP